MSIDCQQLREHSRCKIHIIVNCLLFLSKSIIHIISQFSSEYLKTVIYLGQKKDYVPKQTLLQSFVYLMFSMWKLACLFTFHFIFCSVNIYFTIPLRKLTTATVQPNIVHGYILDFKIRPFCATWSKNFPYIMHVLSKIENKWVRCRPFVKIN